MSWVGGEERALTADYARLVGYVAVLRKRYDRPATLGRILCSIKAYYRYLSESGQRADHPASGLRLRDGARPRVQPQDLMSSGELALLLRPRPERYPLLAHRNAVIIGLLVYQALTVREIATLRCHHLDLTAATVTVPATRQTSGRTLPLAAPQAMQLIAYLNEDRPLLLRDETDRLILTSRGTPERGDGIRYLVETLRPLLPHKRLTPTTIRQSVIAQKLKEGKGLRQVQVFAGHKWISTTEGYRENNLAELRLAVERFHPLGATE